MMAMRLPYDPDDHPQPHQMDFRLFLASMVPPSRDPHPNLYKLWLWLLGKHYEWGIIHDSKLDGTPAGWPKLFVRQKLVPQSGHHHILKVTFDEPPYDRLIFHFAGPPLGPCREECVGMAGTENPQ